MDQTIKKMTRATPINNPVKLPKKEKSENSSADDRVDLSRSGLVSAISKYEWDLLMHHREMSDVMIYALYRRTLNVPKDLERITK